MPSNSCCEIASESILSKLVLFLVINMLLTVKVGGQTPYPPSLDQPLHWYFMILPCTDQILLAILEMASIIMLAIEMAFAYNNVSRNPLGKKETMHALL